MELLLTLLVCLAVGSLVLAIGAQVSREEEVQERLFSYIENHVQGEGEKEKTRINLRQVLEKISRIFASRSYTQKVQFDLLQAGIPLKGEEYLTIWGGLVLVVPPLCWILTFNLPLAVLVLILGAVIPKLYLQSRIDGRRHKLNQQLGDALTVMANALRAGFSFQQAMDTVCRELPAPISTEFGLALREVNLGANTEEALLNMGQRVGSDDLDMVISAVLIQRQAGGNLAQILDNIAGTIRERARIKGQIKTLTAQGRVSGLVIGCMPVGLLFLLLIINPRYMSAMLDSSMGYILLGAAFGSELVGAFIISKMVKIDF
ncbi:MAG: type II secretion system F family protein [Syntrophomonadales bacterium]|jgi:tight adherence protein B